MWSIYSGVVEGGGTQLHAILLDKLRRWAGLRALRSATWFVEARSNLSEESQICQNERPEGRRQVQSGHRRSGFTGVPTLVSVQCRRQEYDSPSHPSMRWSRRRSAGYAPGAVSSPPKALPWLWCGGMVHRFLRPFGPGWRGICAAVRVSVAGPEPTPVPAACRASALLSVNALVGLPSPHTVPSSAPLATA